MAKEIIAVKDLVKNFGSLCAVDKVSLQVNQGDVFGFLGPNGSGKTTTIRLLCGLMTADSGSGHCLGYDIIKESHLIKNQVGYMPQYFSLYKDLTIYDNLKFVAKLYGVENYEDKIKNVMDDFSMTSRKNQFAKNLSGGWKQKLTLAACLVHSPKLLLLDEPTAGIDPRSRRDFWDIIYDLAKDGITTLVTTHYMDEAQRCNRLAYISFSKLVIDGTEEYIIKTIGLKTYNLSGDISGISQDLRKYEEIDVIAFGRSLHISSKNYILLKEVLSPYEKRDNLKIEQIESTIEDAFINMVGASNA